jgi:HK97 gp10 family phage protein
LQVRGLDVLKARFATLKAETAAEVVAQAARKAFEPVLAAARSGAPVDTGLLRDSLKLQVVRPKGGGAVVQVGLKVTSGPGSQKPGRKALPPSRRWHFVEFGTRKMAAHPFLRPALESNAQAVLDILRGELAKGIARAVRQGSKR